MSASLVMVSHDKPSVMMSHFRPSVMMSNFRPSVIMSQIRPPVMVSPFRPSVMVSNFRPSVVLSHISRSSYGVTCQAVYDAVPCQTFWNTSHASPSGGFVPCPVSDLLHVYVPHQSDLLLGSTQRLEMHLALTVNF